MATTTINGDVDVDVDNNNSIEYPFYHHDYDDITQARSYKVNVNNVNEIHMMRMSTNAVEFVHHYNKNTVDDNDKDKEEIIGNYGKVEESDGCRERLVVGRRTAEKVGSGGVGMKDVKAAKIEEYRNMLLFSDVNGD